MDINNLILQYGTGNGTIVLPITYTQHYSVVFGHTDNAFSGSSNVWIQNKQKLLGSFKLLGGWAGASSSGNGSYTCYWISVGY